MFLDAFVSDSYIYISLRLDRQGRSRHMHKYPECFFKLASFFRKEKVPSLVAQLIAA